MKPTFPLLFILFLALILSCKQEPTTQDKFTPKLPVSPKEAAPIKSRPGKNEIFYGILTPVEMSSIFNRLNVPYDNAMLNPTSNRDLYLSSSKISINTGIYGVDLGYLKSFGFDERMTSYMLTIREMCNKLGIAESYMTDPINRIQNQMADPDTIMALMHRAFNNIEEQLKSEGRGSTGGLIVMGGWVEAMFISSQLLYNPAAPDAEVAERIAGQKYTLTSLISFMKNYYEDPVVVYYLKKLKYLNNYFNSFDVYFKKGDLEIDTFKKVLLSTTAETNVTVETLNKIRDYVGKLRTEMVTP